MANRDKKTQQSLVHKFNMMLIETEGKGDYRKEAREIVNNIWAEYSNRQDAALWIYRMIAEYKSNKINCQLEKYIGA